MALFPTNRHDRSGYPTTTPFCPPHLRGLPVGHSYHDVESHQVRDYDETEGVGALFRREFFYEPKNEAQSRPPKSSQPPRDVNALVKALSAGRGKTAAELIAEIACLGPVNLEWLIEQSFDDLTKICEFKKWSLQHKTEAEPLTPIKPELRCSANAVIEAMQAGRSMEDAKLIGEIVALNPQLRANSHLRRSSGELKYLLSTMRAKRAEVRGDTASPTPAGQPLPKIKISVYLDDGNIFEYEVDTVTSAREHVSLIVKTGYRHSDRSRPDELVHFPPHRISKVKMRGHGITTNYYDSPRGT